MTLFAALLLISNVVATKLIAFDLEWSPFGLPVLPIIINGDALLPPLAYMLDDALVEMFEIRGARRVVLLGSGVSLFVLLTFLAVGAAPAAPSYENQETFVTVLGFAPRIIVASLAGYLVGQLLNAWVLVKLKQWRERKDTWKYLLGSIVADEAADTTIFCLIIFGGQIDSSTMLNYIVVGCLFRVGVEAAPLPVTYRVVSLVRSREPEPIKV